MNRSARRATAVIAMAMAAGCAPLPAMQPGQSEAEVLAALGPPTGRHPARDGGLRLEYASGAHGGSTAMIDLDAQRRVVRQTQVLTDASFSTVLAGMTRDELLYRLGQPAFRRGMWRGELWYYRYAAMTCSVFVITLEPRDGPVRDASYAPDPMCEDRAPGGRS
ncbi:MAG: hypothetical protein HY021_02230 [Burkholderiales bacterium]|nr:hypothetical protein [Burkholderiales bacterium]